MLYIYLTINMLDVRLSERIINYQFFQVSEDGTILQSTDVVKPMALI